MTIIVVTIGLYDRNYSSLCNKYGCNVIGIENITKMKWKLTFSNCKLRPQIFTGYDF